MRLAKIFVILITIGSTTALFAETPKSIYCPNVSEIKESSFGDSYHYYATNYRGKPFISNRYIDPKHDLTSAYLDHKASYFLEPYNLYCVYQAPKTQNTLVLFNNANTY